MNTLNEIGRRLVYDLSQARNQKNALTTRKNTEPKIHVLGAGATLTAAYEQLRTAAEYTEEHVLLQRAIRRFYYRLFILGDKARITKSGEELIIELTHAGYIPNDTVPESIADVISRLAASYYEAHTKLRNLASISREQSEHWTYELLAVEIDWLMNDGSEIESFAHFAHSHLLTAIDLDMLGDKRSPDVEIALYVAIHRALLKSDDAAVRLGLVRRFSQSVNTLDGFIEVNKKIDSLFLSREVDALVRVVDRRGAPLRVLRHMIEEQPDFETVIETRGQFLLAFEAQVNSDYAQINKRVNNGIIKSVVFLLITKFLIGIAIEIPYDLLFLGAIVWLPLLINLFFPPIYMVLLRATMMLPGSANTTRLVDQIDQTLYAEQSTKQLSRRAKQEFGTGYNVAYVVLLLTVFGGVAYLLWSLLDFDIVHLAIFFVFLSAASFLGFRLSRIIREIESIETHQNAVTLVRDFLYMPFVIVGRFLSERYARVNIVALALDMFIELPLKTILRLVRQWAAFIASKKDEL